VKVLHLVREQFSLPQSAWFFYSRYQELALSTLVFDSIPAGSSNAHTEPFVLYWGTSSAFWSLIVSTPFWRLQPLRAIASRHLGENHSHAENGWHN
jgi:hypothetical protein